MNANFKQSALKLQYMLAVWAGFLGGNISSFVKSGAESFLPPRLAERVGPPIQMIEDLGLRAEDLIYTYSGHIMNWGALGIHHLFSIFFAVLYCLLVELFPRVALWQGLAFGLVITVVFHGAVLPLCGWSPMIWQLPAQELLAELLGHGAWIWTIEIFRRAILSKFALAPSKA